MQKQYTCVKIFEPAWPTRRYYCRYKSEVDQSIPGIIDVNDLPPVKQGLNLLVNIHVFVKDTEDWIRHIAFRDYLISNSNYRDAYGQLKKDLAKNEYEDMIAYNDAKDDFVKEVQSKALEWYLNKR